jgi:hypothetical protein
MVSLIVRLRLRGEMLPPRSWTKVCARSAGPKHRGTMRAVRSVGNFFLGFTVERCFRE